MDIHLDTLLGFPNVTVFTCYQKEGFIILELELINQGINCPHCQTYTDKWVFRQYGVKCSGHYILSPSD